MDYLIDGGATGNSVGIDPDALDTLINEAEDAAEAVEEFVGDFKGRFQTNQVSTSNLTQLEQVAEWVRDQLPMLRRRRDIAAIAAEINKPTLRKFTCNDFSKTIKGIAVQIATIGN